MNGRRASQPAWRPPEAPRPPRVSSRRAAASAVLVGALLAEAPEARAGAVIGYEDNGRTFCAGRPGFRQIRGAVPDGAGGFLLVTDDVPPFFTPSEGQDVFLIHVDAGFLPLPVGDGPFSLDPCGAPLVGGLDRQEASGVMATGPASFVVALTDDRDGPDRAYVSVQRFDAQGTPLLADLPLLISDRAFESRYPRVADDGAGGLFIAWAELVPPQPSFTGRLLLQRLDAGGQPVWPAPVAVSLGDNLIYFETVMAADGAGGVYVAWREFPPDTDPGAGTIRVQRVRADGVPLWPAGGVSPWNGRDDYTGLGLAAEPDGVVLVFTTSDIRAQKFSPAGERLWGSEALLVSDVVPGSHSDFPEILRAPGGDFFVVWDELRFDAGWTVAARRLNRDGTLPWPSAVPAFAPDGLIGTHAGAVLADGSLAVAWEDMGHLGDTSSLVIQNVDGRGRTKVPAGGLPIAVAPGRQTLPVFLDAAPGAPIPEATVAWSDTRYPSPAGESWSLLAQKVRFFSAPRLDPVVPVTVIQGDTLALALRGDDLQPGAGASAGADVALEGVEVIAEAPDGPGDSIRLRLRVGPDARAGPRDLTLVNPDGGATLPAPLLSIGLRPGRQDIDGSGRVDGYDLALLARAFGTRDGAPAYLPASDLDSDGSIDGIDLALLASRFGAAAADESR